MRQFCNRRWSAIVRGIVVAVATTALCGAAAISAYAQSQAIDGTIEGFTRGAKAEAMAGVKVQAVNTGTGYERNTVSDVAGRFSLSLLPPGAYVVIASKDGFGTVSKENLDVKGGQVLTLEINLSSTSFSETVSVTGVSPTVEIGRTVNSNTYDERTVRSLPLAGRSIQDFYMLQPGVNAGPPDGGSGSATPTISTVYGGLGLRQMNVDGVSNNLQGGARNLVISEESVSEFQTVTNFSAEFGRVAGGLQNAITKSGSNTMHGSAYLFTRQKFLSASPFLQAPGTPKPDFSRYNFGGAVGGPLIKNRAFLFLNYERWMADAPTVSTFKLDDAVRLGIPSDQVGTYNAAFRAHTLTAKVDFQGTRNTRISTRYFYYYDRESPNTFGGSATKDVATRFDESPQSITTQIVSVLNSNIVNEGRFLFESRGISNGVGANPNTPNISLSGIGNFNGNANGNKTTRERGLQFIDNLSIVKGAHSVKMGFDILPVWFNEGTSNVNGTFTFGGLSAVSGVRGAVTPTDQFLFTEAGAIDPSTGKPYSYSRFTQTIGPEFFQSLTVNQGYFVQDDIRVSNAIKLNVGLRYEYFTRPTGNPNPALPGSGVFPADRNNFAPRIGVAWDPFGNGKDVVRAGYGIFYNMVTSQTFNSFLRGNGSDVLNLSVTPGQAGAPVFARSPVARISGVNVVSDVRLMDPSFQDIKVHEVYLTYERQIGADMSLSLSGRLNRARNLPMAIDTNLASAGTLPDGTPKWTSTGRPNPAFGNIFVSESLGYQNYRGLVTTLTKRFSHGASFQISHHWSHVEGAAYVSDFTGFGIFTTPSNPQDLSSDVGLGDFDMPQRLTVTGVFEPSSASLHGIAGTILNGWQVSPRIVATKGYPFIPLTGLDTNGDSVFNDRPSGYAYNSFRVPGYYAIDGRITRKIKLNAQTLELIVEGFNLANQLTPTGPSAINRTWGTGTTPNATFNTLISSQASRQIQIAARLTF